MKEIRKERKEEERKKKGKGKVATKIKEQERDSISFSPERRGLNREFLGGCWTSWPVAAFAAFMDVASSQFFGEFRLPKPANIL